MFDILFLNDLNPGKLRKQFDKTIEELAAGNFIAAEVKKMTGTPYYRARLDYESRLLFRFGKYDGRTFLLILEILFHHDYEKSRFLRGVEINESKLVPLSGGQIDSIPDQIPLIYINKRIPKFHLLDKILSFDDQQEEILNFPLPQIIIGSAGSGKTALTLERIKTLPGQILYVTLSAYLAENSSQWYYANHYENEHQEVDFLSYKEFIETIRIPEGKELDFRIFEGWFSGYRQAVRLKDAHAVFEEFRGVITGMDISKKHLTREDYLGLGVKQSIFLSEERERVYTLFEKYLLFLNENSHYDINIYSHHVLQDCHPIYDYIVVDEVQDFTNIQLLLMLKSLKKPMNFILCGDANQVVYPNFFSWSHLKSMFYQQEVKGNEIRILHANYRNSPAISDLANRLLKIKNARFGSLDKESNYLVTTISQTEGEMIFLEEKGKTVADLAKKTRMSVNYAVLVLRNEDKSKARSLFPSPLLFSVQESKGLEYENIILYNFISDNATEYNNLCDGVTPEALIGESLIYSRGKDKSDKSLDVYKFYINSLYVAITRAVKNVYIVEQTRGHKLIRLLGIAEDSKARIIREEVSSSDDWKREARRLDMQGKTEQAEAIRKNILVTSTPNWKPMTFERYLSIKKEALDPANFNKKAKDLLFDFALIHNHLLILEKLAELKYRRAENYENERGSIFRKYYQYYKEDNLKMIVQEVNRYGIDFRDVHNFTPLHAAVFSGALKITSTLLENGANPELTDTFHKNPVQIALRQAFLLPDYAKNKLGRIYPLLLSDSLKIQVEGFLIKVDPHKIEFLMVHLFITIQANIQQTKLYYESFGIKIDDLIQNLQYFPDIVLPAYRKRREYWLAVLAKHEINSKNPYNKKLFRRIDRGTYILNQAMQIWHNGEWIIVNNIMGSQDITEEEIKARSYEKEMKKWEEWKKRIAKEKEKRERLGW